MAIDIDMPATLACGRDCSLTLVDTDLATRGDQSGATQVRFYGLPMWSMVLVAPPVLNDAQAGEWKSLGLRLRGLKNRLVAFDPSRPYPKGTLRGSPILQATLASGDSTMLLNVGASQVGRTLECGDLVQIGQGRGTSQLVACVQSSVVGVDGLIAVVFEPPARRGYAFGVPVALERPRVYMRRVEPTFGWTNYSGDHTRQMQLQLFEAP